MTAASVTLLSVVIACGDDNVRASDYDQTCATDEDCVLVTEVVDGSGCSADCSDSCERVAINERDHASYDEDRRAALENCGARSANFCDSPLVAACVRGVCSAVLPSGPDAGP